MFDPKLEFVLFLNNNANILMASCVLMLLDVVTGLFKAFYTHSYDSSKMREGLFHKMGFVFLIILSAFFEVFINAGHITVDFTFPACSIICAYVLLCEFTSIVENISTVNPTIAKLTCKYLAQVACPVNTDTTQEPPNDKE